MIYQLKLDVPIGNFRTIAVINQQFKKNLEGIKSFEKRLKFYNEKIRSLSTYEKCGGQLYFEWGLPDQKIKVFCNCNICKSLPDFNQEHEKIYFKLRTEEIKRLEKGINAKNNYTDKLTFLFKTPGYIPDHTPAVYDDFKSDKSVIDLRPETKEEIIIYNQFVITAFDEEYKDGNGFSNIYNGFDFEKEKTRLEKTLLRSKDGKVLLENIKDEIEKHFGYPDFSKQDEKKNKNISSHILASINQQLESLDYGSTDNWFAKMILGIEIDINKQVIHTQTLFRYTHISEISKYYLYVKELIEKPALVQNSTVKWKGKNKNDLAYLFWKLEKEKIITTDNLGLTLSKIFIDAENKPIENTLFNKYKSEFNKNQFPANANEIDKLISILKKGTD